MTVYECFQSPNTHNLLVSNGMVADSSSRTHEDMAILHSNSRGLKRAWRIWRRLTKSQTVLSRHILFAQLQSRKLLLFRCCLMWHKMAAHAQVPQCALE